MLNVEIGKTYVDGKGERVRIVAEYKHDKYPLIGIVVDKDGGECIGTYKRDGSHSDYAHDLRSLVSEYVPPRKVEGWVNVYKEKSLSDSLGLLVATKYEAKKNISSYRDYIATIFISATEGEK